MASFNFHFGISADSYLQSMKRAKGLVTVEVHNSLKRLWIGAAKEFVRAMAREGMIKVDTGMSKASLIPLGRVLKITGEISISPKRTRKGYTDINGNWVPSGTKSVATGIDAGESAFTIEHGSPGNPLFIFEYNLSVFQHDYWDPYWGSLEAGKAAFIQHLEDHYVEELERVPQFKRLGEEI